MPQPALREDLLALREERYRRRPELRLRTVEDAREFIARVGFAFLFPIQGAELPSLWDAVCGRTREVTPEHRDPDIEKTWGWKDRSLGQGWWYYGKFFLKKASFIDLAVLPYFYALKELTGDPDDALNLYDYGLLSAEAKRLYDILQPHGRLNVLQWRQLAGGMARAPFERALTELQHQLLVLPVGVDRAGAWRYAFSHDLVARHFPDLPHQAAPIALHRARKAVLERYLWSVVAAPPRQAARLLGLSLEEVLEAAEDLASEGSIVREGDLLVTAGL